MYPDGVRILGVDVGRRRIGLAVSDASAVVARPWRMLPAGESPRASADRVVAVLAELDDPLEDRSSVGAIVVGLPRRLDGTDTDMTGPAREIASALHALTGVEVHLQDERLTSREAESRLAEREPDWRRRKRVLDAAAAAIILQDYLDQRASRPAADEHGRAGA